MFCFIEEFERIPVQDTTPPCKDNENKMTLSILKDGLLKFKSQLTVKM